VTFATLLPAWRAGAGIFHDENSRRVVARDGERNDRMGFSVAVDGLTVSAGAPFDDDLGADAGAVYQFDAATGAQLRKIVACDAGDWFGSSVAAHSGRLLVGAQFDTPQSGFRSGSAYLFNTQTGGQLAHFWGSDSYTGDTFGFAAALDDRYALVGAPRHDFVGGAYDAGAAYLFDVVTGLQTQRLIATDRALDDQLGTSVALAGNLALVGAPQDDDRGADSGSAYLFNTETGAQVRKLRAADGAAGDHFGRAVAASGNLALVGAYGDDPRGTDSGAAYLFNLATGQQLAKLTPDDGTAGDHFGYAVALAGNLAVIGAPFDDEMGGDAGSFYVFDVDKQLQLGKFSRSWAFPRQLTGQSVAIAGETIAVGAPHTFINYGGVVVMQSTVPEPLGMTLMGIVVAGAGASRRRAAVNR